ERLWFLDQLDPGGVSYSVPGALRLRGRLDTSALVASLREVVRRHDVLRTTYEGIDGSARPLLHDVAEFDVRIEDLGHLSEIERDQEVLERVSNEARTPFNLSRGPVVRACLLRLTDDVHVLLFTMHHIASDGWSRTILVREVAVLYEAYSAGR